MYMTWTSTYDRWCRVCWLPLCQCIRIGHNWQLLLPHMRTQFTSNERNAPTHEVLSTARGRDPTPGTRISSRCVLVRKTRAHSLSLLLLPEHYPRQITLGRRGRIELDECHTVCKPRHRTSQSCFTTHASDKPVRWKDAGIVACVCVTRINP